MNPDEAAMQMELLDKDFFVFMNDKSNVINVIYRRKEGNFRTDRATVTGGRWHHE